MEQTNSILCPWGNVLQAGRLSFDLEMTPSDARSRIRSRISGGETKKFLHFKEVPWVILMRTIYFKVQKPLILLTQICMQISAIRYYRYYDTYVQGMRHCWRDGQF